MATNGSFTQQDQYKNNNEHCPSNFNPTSNTVENSSSNSLAKDEVSWYFVEQFYTTLSKNPEKLHLFYGNASQFVFGLEAEVSSVSVGRDAIQERIKELNFHDYKVRVSNVDTQGSHNSIVIQVIGEISVSSEPRKFVQTFVLAQQPTGYFVLNDIFRYITEDPEDEAIQNKAKENIADTSLVEENHEIPKEEVVFKEKSPNPSELDVEDLKLEKTLEPELPQKEPLTTNGTQKYTPPVPTVSTVDEETNNSVTEEPSGFEATEKPSEEFKEPKQPQDSSTSLSINAANPSKPSSVVQQHGPPKPLSWASRAAAAVGSTPKPAVPVVAPRNTTPAQNRASSALKSAQVTNTVSNTQNDKDKEKEKEKENIPMGSGWQTAGENQKKQNRPTSMSAPPEKECTMGYVRNVTEKVEAEELRTVLGSFGDLIYFDVNRHKNCAFVEYATTEGYQAANNASPVLVSGETIYVEPRRPKANAYGGNGYPGGRGGMNQRGRGGFANRGRGSGTFRGRGQANNA